MSKFVGDTIKHVVYCIILELINIVSQSTAVNLRSAPPPLHTITTSEPQPPTPPTLVVVCTEGVRRRTLLRFVVFNVITLWICKIRMLYIRVKVS
jgi:hypothetical protein